MKGLLLSIWKEQVSCRELASISSNITYQYAQTRAAYLFSKLLLYREKKLSWHYLKKVMFSIEKTHLQITVQFIFYSLFVIISKGSDICKLSFKQNTNCYIVKNNAGDVHSHWNKSILWSNPWFTVNCIHFRKINKIKALKKMLFCRLTFRLNIAYIILKIIGCNLKWANLRYEIQVPKMCPTSALITSTQ